MMIHAGLVQNSLALRIQGLLELAIVKTVYPRSLVGIAIQPLRGADSDLFFSAVFNSSVLALIDAGIPLSSVPVAVRNLELEAVFSHTSKGALLVHQAFFGHVDLPTALRQAEEQSIALFTRFQQTIHQVYV